jgi:phosphoglycerate dehydrogenase-like enzyme
MFRVGVTVDIRGDDGSPVFDLGLLDDAEEVQWQFLGEDVRELTASDVSGYEAVIVFSPSVSAATLETDEPPILLARLGVGYDRVDVDACTQRGVLLTVTPDGVRRPMAAAAMCFILALAHRVLEKDRHVRSGRWARFLHPGTGLRGRTLGLLGLGNVGQDLICLLEPFEMRLLANDPYIDNPPTGVELGSLEKLIREADFLVVLCPLTDETRHLIDARRLAQMKRSAFLINIARGPIVDQAALTDALRARRIAGAALDVFEQEPIDPADPLLSLDNVILAPHAIGVTDEIFRGSGRSACRSVLAAADGRVPEHVVNPEALAHPRLQRLA